MIKATNTEFQVNDRWVSAGQPTEARLREVVEAGAVVVSLRGPAEDPFDEVALIEGLGGTFHRIATGGPSFQDPDWVSAIRELFQKLEETDADVYLHCGSANRTGAAWAIYNFRNGKYANVQAALQDGQRCGMTKLGPMLQGVLTQMG